MIVNFLSACSSHSTGHFPPKLALIFGASSNLPQRSLAYSSLVLLLAKSMTNLCRL